MPAAVVSRWFPRIGFGDHHTDQAYGQVGTRGSGGSVRADLTPAPVPGYIART